MKRFLLSFLCCCALFSIECAAKKFKVKVDGIEMQFKIISEEEHTVEFIMSNKLKVEVLNIPSTVEYNQLMYSVKSIAPTKTGVISNDFLREVFIPEGVERIRTYAFVCSKMNYVHFPSTLREIDHYAFFNSPIIDLEIPDGVTRIGEYAFSCYQDYVTKLGDKFYRGTLRLPAHPLSIGFRAFCINGAWGYSHAYSHFEVHQLPEGTSVSEMHNWYIEQANGSMIQEGNSILHPNISVIH